MKKLLFLIIPIIILLVASSCEKEPDPCQDVNINQADFKIEQSCPVCDNDWKYFYEDDTMYPSTVRFTVKNQCDSCKWFIGRSIFKQKQFDLDFRDVGNGTKIPIKLVTYNKINNNCPKSHKEADTLVKNIVLIKHFEFLGKFRGYILDAPDKIFDITIGDTFFRFDSNSSQERYGITIDNLPLKVNGMGLYDVNAPSNRVVDFGLRNDSLTIGYVIQISKDKKIEINFDIQHYRNPGRIYTGLSKKIFKGIKIS